MYLKTTTLKQIPTGEQKLYHNTLINSIITFITQKILQNHLFRNSSHHMELYFCKERRTQLSRWSTEIRKPLLLFFLSWQNQNLVLLHQKRMRAQFVNSTIATEILSGKIIMGKIQRPRMATVVNFGWFIPDIHKVYKGIV